MKILVRIVTLVMRFNLESYFHLKAIRCLDILKAKKITNYIANISDILKANVVSEDIFKALKKRCGLLNF